MNKSGKTLTIFIVVIAILLVSLSVIAVFFFLQEVELRKSAEYNLEQMRIRESKMQQDYEAAKKQLFVFEEKNKEAEGKIESLLEELELEQGLREEIKKDYRELKEVYDKEAEQRKKLESELDSVNQQKDELEEELNSTQDRHKDLQHQFDNLKSQYESLTGTPLAMEGSEEIIMAEEPPLLTNEDDVDDVELEKIVINPSGEKAGEIISIDTETNFFIVNMGGKDGLRNGTVLSIYREETHLGDAKVTRVLPEMSAADFVPPLTSEKVKKSDKIIIKE